jgi:hypothetical protein
MESQDSFDVYRMPDAMWEKIRLLLPDHETYLLGGRPWRDLRSVADAIFYRLRTGCQWKAIPKSLAPGSTAHGRAGIKFSYWSKCQSSRFPGITPHRANNPPKQYFLRPGNARLFAAMTYGLRDPFGPVLEMHVRTGESTGFREIR